MSETSKFTPSTESERLARVKNLKPRKGNEGRRIMKDLEKAGRAMDKDKEKAGRQMAAEKRRREREIRAVEVNAENLKTALARAEEKDRAAKEPKVDDFESYEVSGGEIELEKDEKKEEAFKEVMVGLKGKLAERKKARTQKSSEEAVGIMAEEVVPSQVEEGFDEAVEINVKKEKGKPVTSEDAVSVFGEINNDLKLEKKKVTNKNVISRASHEDTIAKAEEVAHDKLVKAARKSAAKNIPFITEKNIEESRSLAEQDEEKEWFAQEPESEEKSAEVTRPKTMGQLRERIAASENVAEFAGGLIAEKAEAMQKEMDETVEFFLQKNKDLKDKASVHKFLMGEEIKGWFKGKQRQLQAKYKENVNNPIYKEWQRMKGKR